MGRGVDAIDTTVSLTVAMGQGTRDKGKDEKGKGKRGETQKRKKRKEIKVGELNPEPASRVQPRLRLPSLRPHRQVTASSHWLRVELE
jgi:hypothetical protein